MITRLRFILGWTKLHKVMSFTFLVILSLIVASNILLVQFFYGESTADNQGLHYCTYYFDEEISVDDATSVLDMLCSKVDVYEYMVASKSEEESENSYRFAAYIQVNDNEEEKRNNALSYGKWLGSENTYVEDNNELTDASLAGYECVGEGSIQMGDEYVDYRLTPDDYKKIAGGIDAVEVTTLKKARNIVDSVIDELGVGYDVEYSDLFLESGFESVKYSIIICVCLLLISLYSIIAFVELYLHMQRQDLLVFYRCGATFSTIKNMYFVEMIAAGVVSFMLGTILAQIICKIINLSFDKISMFVILITFVVFIFLYLLETYIYIRSTLKYLKKIDIG